MADDEGTFTREETKWSRASEQGERGPISGSIVNQLGALIGLSGALGAWPRPQLLVLATGAEAAAARLVSSFPCVTCDHNRFGVTSPGSMPAGEAGNCRQVKAETQ